MEFTKTEAHLPDCCRLKLDLGAYEFGQYMANDVVMGSVAPTVKSPETRMSQDPKVDISKSDIIHNDWENQALYEEWPEMQKILKALPNCGIEKAHIRTFPPGRRLKIHRDGYNAKGEPQGQFDMFNRTMRIHVALQTNPKCHMYAEGKFYHMAVGEVWMLNNFANHSMLNLSETEYRVHLVVDLKPSQDMMDLVDASEKNLGFVDAELLAQIT
ncbi:MAG: aspartyl/asparaginyl beta-hydroxylase domain-containing protein [Sulfitobacter sp.]